MTETCFHAAAVSRPFFEGWYFKHQSDEHTLILIPAFHRDENGEKSASLQIILDDVARRLDFSADDFEADTKRLHVRLGQNVFSEKGCRLHIDLPGLTLRGHLRYGAFYNPKRSLMGPLGRLPLPCFHEVLSLFHRLRGLITVNGQLWDFSDGFGYLEKDWGHSFPSSYLWLQCGWQEAADRSCVMLAIASLGISQLPFTACGSLILCKGKQYRLSTYQGAQLTHCGGRRIALRQGPWLLQVILPPDTVKTASSGALLLAPEAGRMSRTIREYSRCQMRCQLYKGGKRILDTQKDAGSLERV